MAIVPNFVQQTDISCKQLNAKSFSMNNLISHRVWIKTEVTYSSI